MGNKVKNINQSNTRIELLSLYLAINSVYLIIQAILNKSVYKQNLGKTLAHNNALVDMEIWDHIKPQLFGRVLHQASRPF